MDTVLEEKRSLHEERDRVELAIVNEMLSKKQGHKDKLDSEHRQRILLDRYMKCSKDLCNLYKKDLKSSSIRLDDDPTHDLNPLQGAFQEFYSALNKIGDYYSENENEQVVTMASEFEELEASRQIALGLKTNNHHTQQQSNSAIDNRSDDDEDHDRDDDDDHHNHDDDRAHRLELMRLSKGMPTTNLVDLVEQPQQQAAPTIESKAEKLVEFTDEEGYGRYLDLNKCHGAFLQVLKKEEAKPNYLTFLDKFDRYIGEMKREQKLNSLYKTYLEEILAYFRDYSRRARPLFDNMELENKVHEEFVEQWNKRALPGWFDSSDRLQEGGAEPMIELESYKSHQHLMELGLDCLKKELQARGLKCGGTLEERARRLWLVRGKSFDEIDNSLRAGSSSKSSKKKSSSSSSSTDPFYIASMEAKLSMYADYFNDHRLATIENVQRKQARTADERNDSDEDVSDADEEETDQNDVVYNPKNLPLGWDGKPIPYWLYKLHGLNLTFSCEICGNATYKGPKTFQRHFAEWRHAHGMRCLGIPNTAHFANITKIQDAISLWEKLKNEKQKDKFQPLVEEEFEDSQGNVVNKKTYEDLKRQGLL